MAKLVGQVFSFIGQAVGTIAKFIGTALSAIVGDVGEAGAGIVQNVSNTVRQVAQLISNLINAISGLGGQILDKLFGINLGDVVTAPLNALADGIDNVGASVSNYIQSVNSRANALVAPKVEQSGSGPLQGSNFLDPSKDGGGKGVKGTVKVQVQQSVSLS